MLKRPGAWLFPGLLVARVSVTIPVPVCWSLSGLYDYRTGLFDPPTYNRGVENGTIIASQVAWVEPDLRGRVVHTLATPSAGLSSAIDTTAQLPLVWILR